MRQNSDKGSQDNTLLLKSHFMDFSVLCHLIGVKLKHQLVTHSHSRCPYLVSMLGMGLQYPPRSSTKELVPRSVNIFAECFIFTRLWVWLLVLHSCLNAKCPFSIQTIPSSTWGAWIIDRWFLCVRLYQTSTSLCPSNSLVSWVSWATMWNHLSRLDNDQQNNKQQCSNIA